MVRSQVPDAASDTRLAWVIGGVLLIAAMLVGVVVQYGSLLGSGGAVVAAIWFPAALLVFAFGVRGSGSVTDRRPLGTAALTALAAWVLLGQILLPTFRSGSVDPGLLLALGFIDSLVQFTLALIAVVQIARAGVVPRPWNWAPSWALAAIAVPWVLEQIIAAGAAQTQDAPFVVAAVLTLDSFVHVGSAVFLGVLAIVLANTSRSSRRAATQPDNDVVGSR